MRWIGPILIAIAFVAALFWSWGKWPDALIDFGRELYTPWRLTEGDVLYRDVRSFYGPLSPYLNACWFSLFGVGLRTLALCNAAISALMLFWLYRVLTIIGGRLSATVGCLVFIGLFGFAHLIAVGNYNFICPYSHEAVHGVALSIGMILALLRWMQTSRLAYAAAAGLAYGLIFLTKPESFIAATAAGMGIDIALLLMPAAQRPRPLLKHVVVFVACAAAPVAIAFALLCTAMPAGPAMSGVLGSWPFIFNEQLTSMPFFKIRMGTSDPRASLVATAMAVVWQCMIILPVVVIALLASSDRRTRTIAAALTFAGICGLLLSLRKSPGWADVARPFPVYLVLTALAALVALVKLRASAAQNADGSGAAPQAQQAVRAAGRLAFAMFAAALTIKMILYCRFFNYGFVLAMPATLLMAVVLLDWLPEFAARWNGSPAILRGGALAMIAVTVALYLNKSDRMYAGKTHFVPDSEAATPSQPARAADRFLADARAPFVNDIIAWLDANAQPAPASLVVLPEGVMINYLTRRPSSVPYLTFVPSDLVMFSEQAMLESLRASPPDYIVLVHRDTSEYGPALLGRDYGRSIMRWVYENYRQQHVVGQPPLHDETLFGIAVLKRLGAE